MGTLKSGWYCAPLTSSTCPLITCTLWVPPLSLKSYCPCPVSNLCRRTYEISHHCHNYSGTQCDDCRLNRCQDAGVRRWYASRFRTFSCEELCSNWNKDAYKALVKNKTKKYGRKGGLILHVSPKLTLKVTYLNRNETEWVVISQTLRGKVCVRTEDIRRTRWE